jgi:hypothetical protein
VDLVPDPLRHSKSNSDGNRTRTSGSVTRVGSCMGHRADCVLLPYGSECNDAYSNSGSRKRRQKGNTVSDETVMYGYWSSVTGLDL